MQLYIDRIYLTGDIGFRYIDYLKKLGPSDKRSSVTVYDLNQAMLDVGRQRANKWVSSLLYS